MESKSVEDLVEVVQVCFEESGMDTLGKVWLMLQKVMMAVMGDGGGNRFPLPHTGSGDMWREGTIPLNLKCTKSLVNLAKHTKIY